MVKADRIECLLAFEKMNGPEHEAQDRHTDRARHPNRADFGGVSGKQAYLFKVWFLRAISLSIARRGQYLHMSNINVLIGALLERPEQPFSDS